MPTTNGAQRFAETERFFCPGVSSSLSGNLFHPGYLEVLIIRDDLCIHKSQYDAIRHINTGVLLVEGTDIRLLRFFLMPEVPIMKGTSYLLSLDGSSESRSAASFAWALANRTGARVVAQYVVDSAAVWRFLSFDLAGFVGSGVFMAAREKIIDALHSIAEALLLSYAYQAEGQGIEPVTCIDEGDPVTEIANRAIDHDLIIYGYKQHSDTHPKFLEQLMEVSPCPILVVRNTTTPWSKLQIFATSDIADHPSIPDLYGMGLMLGLPVEVYLDNEAIKMSADAFTLGGWSSALGVKTIRKGCLNDLLKTSGDDVLIVVPISALREGKFTRNLTVVKNPPAQTELRMDQNAEEAEDSGKGSRLVS